MPATGVFAPDRILVAVRAIARRLDLSAADNAGVRLFRAHIEARDTVVLDRGFATFSR